ncbi:unnamed protein product [Schistocephalus solidus]|uniref:Uncharacterized protein n=1 Tax=Schistocephalus solidus TaxID=70667 RepID=A0A183SHP0_SCHSO|nr:unnamed protein product [Schistocephalus solidus]
MSGHTGQRLGTGVNENKLPIRREGYLFLVFANALECDHRFDCNETEVIAMPNTKGAGEFLDAWYTSAGRIDNHVDLDIHYQGLSSRLTASRPNSTSTTGNTDTRNATDPPSTLPLQHRELELFRLPLPLAHS